MPKKIKVVDIVNNETIDSTVEQPIIEKQEQINTAVETTPITNTETESTEVKEEDKPTDEDDKPIEKVVEKQKIVEGAKSDKTTKTRTQELHECPKCHKFMTLKTLTYVHQNTCPIKDPPKPKAKGRPKKIKPPNTPDQSVQDTFVPQPKQAPILNEAPVKSFEEMRKDRLLERVNQRKQKISNLFLQAF